MTRLVAAFARPPADLRSDGALLAAFLADRDEPAFAELVRRHGPLVWATCRRSLPDPADAEDAFQATFLVLVRRGRQFHSSVSLGPWLYRVAAWTARALRRKNARRRATFAALPASVPDSRTASSTFELDDLLLALPEKYRAAIVLCHLQGLTHREAADRLGCAEGTVASLVSRALGKLRTKLGAPALVAAAALVPTELAASAVRSAVAWQLSTFSAAASPAVASLTEGVLRMFWVKKAAAVSAAMVLVAGFGLGVGVQQSPRSVAADDPPGKKGGSSQATDDIARIDAELEAVRRKFETGAEEFKRLKDQSDALSQRAQVVREELDALSKRGKDLTAQRDREIARAKAVTKVKGDEVKDIRDRTKIEITLRATAVDLLILKELNASGEALWTVTCPSGNRGDTTALRKYLTRARQDKDGPQELTISCEPEVPFKVEQSVMKAAQEAGFTAITAKVVRGDADRAQPVQRNVVLKSISSTTKPMPSRNLEVGGEGSDGKLFPVKLKVGETVRVNLAGGWSDDPVPLPPRHFEISGDAQGLIVTGVEPGHSLVPVRDRANRKFWIQVSVEPAKP